MTKRTFGGTSRKRKRVSGFRVRMRSHTGRRVIKSRRQKGRERIAVWLTYKWPYLNICVWKVIGLLITFIRIPQNIMGN